MPAEVVVALVDGPRRLAREMRSGGLGDTVGDLGDLKDRRDGGADALEFSGLLQRRDEVLRVSYIWVEGRGGKVTRYRVGLDTLSWKPRRLSHGVLRWPNCEKPPRITPWCAIGRGTSRRCWGSLRGRHSSRALDLFEAEGRAGGEAVDLACGEGRDTLELLRRGWRVIAIEEHPRGFELLLPRVPSEQRGLLETRTGTFRTLELPATDLLNASFCLPFCAPADFPALWRTIVQAIRPGGRFAGQLFGDRDSWAVLPDRTHPHTLAGGRAVRRVRDRDAEGGREGLRDRRGPA